jgi:YbgC/YbaW family acyl-CoA thioester hydrolase
MAVVHTLNLRVHSYDLGSNGAAGHAAFLRWFQEAAFEASAARGYGMKEYDAMGAAWLMRSVDVEFLQPARYQDEIEIRTWVSDFQRVRAHREYEARRANDAALLARARADWVFLDSKTFALRRVPAEAAALFEPNGQPALDATRWRDLAEGKPLGHFEATRRVQQYELDWMQHVNNTIYVNWIEQQAHDAWRAWARDPAALNLQRHLIEYRQPAKDGDTLQVISDAARVDAHIVWKHRILRGETLLIQAQSLSALPIPPK